MKYLLVLVVIGVLWMLFKRSGGRKGPDDDPLPPAAPKPPTAIWACAHCGLHLPQAEAVADAAGRAYCSDAHRAAGPR